jgi:hypothetical protein
MSQTKGTKRLATVMYPRELFPRHQPRYSEAALQNPRMQSLLSFQMVLKAW